MKGPAGKHCDYAWDRKVYRIFNPTTYKVVESRNLTFVEAPAFSPLKQDLQSLLDEMENIDYATDVFTCTSLWDNAYNSSIAEPQAQGKNLYIVWEAQSHNERLQIQLGTTGANAGVDGVAPMEPIQNPRDRVEQPEPVPDEPESADMAAVSSSSAPAPVWGVTRASTRSNPSSESVDSSNLPPG